MIKTAWFGAMVAVLAMGAASARGSIIHVPADQPTIQAGVDAAAALDTVLVAPGTYLENVLINAKPVYLSSHFLVSGDTAEITRTVINGSQPISSDSGSVIRVLNTTGAVVRGFTITGGTGTRWRDQSDGLFYREGGGILTEGGNPRIMDNLVISNEAVDLSGGVRSAGGGAIRCGYGSAEILHNVIAHNRGYYGGGIVAFHNPVTMRNNIICGNSGGEHFGGGGAWITSSDGTNLLANNTFVDNRSAADGGGLLLWSNTATLLNNIFWGNEAGNGPQIRQRSGPTVSVQYCDVQGGWAGTGNFDMDPQLETPALVLMGGSPCIDAGNPAVPYNDPQEAGQPGVARYPARGTTRDDAGAYGGPGSALFPVFNAPGIGVLENALDLETVEVADSGTAWIRVTKSAFGLCRIDSVTFTGPRAADLALSSGLPMVLGPAADDSLDSLAVSWAPSTYGPLNDTAWLFHDDRGTASPIAVELTGEAPGTTGDPNQDGVMNSADVIYLVNFVFKSGPAPKPVRRSGDVNCDALVTASDVIQMVNFVFKSGPAPCV